MRPPATLCGDNAPSRDLDERGVRALDGLLKLAQRRGKVRASELAQRLGGVVLVGALPHRRGALACGHDEAGRVLLGGDDDKDAAVELACSLGGVEELPQPGDRGLRVAMFAVVDAQPATAAVLAGLGDLGTQLLDQQPNAARGDARDPVAGLRVRGAVVVGAEQGVDGLCRWLSSADVRRERARDLAATLGIRRNQQRVG